jgi:hypothetical protein
LRGFRQREGRDDGADRSWRGRTSGAYQLELVDLAFRLTAAPWHRERRPDRRLVLLQIGCEGLDDRNTTGAGLLKPDPENRGGRSFVAVDIAASHQLGEAPDQGEDAGNLAILSNPGERRAGRGVEQPVGLNRLAQFSIKKIP